jgi:FKBP-type peptidyl-prolyl cis-trans isomerase FkpA
MEEDRRRETGDIFEGTVHAGLENDHPISEGCGMNRRFAGRIRTSAIGATVGATVLAMGAGLSGCTDPTAPRAQDIEFAAGLGIDLSLMEELPSGLWIRDEVTGEGPAVVPINRVQVDYQGWLPDGTLFDSSLEREPLSLIVAQRRVIEGFGEGVVGMREGGRRLILVPPSLGYGSNPPGAVIPPDSWLVFRLFLRNIES